MTFKFKTTKPRRTRVKAAAPARVAKPREEIGLIQGRVPDSKEEWWVSVWLTEHKLQYDYQYVVFPQAAKGFYFIDFLVYTAPLRTMLEINGAHWHTGELGQDDRLRQLEIEQAMMDIARIPVQYILAADMISRETVEAALGRIFNG